MKDDVRFTESSGNVFADLGLDDADELEQKAYLVNAINNSISKRNIGSDAVETLLGATRDDVPSLFHGDLDNLTLEQLKSWAAKTETWN